jgi:hypothetical protein
MIFAINTKDKKRTHGFADDVSMSVECAFVIDQSTDTKFGIK